MTADTHARLTELFAEAIGLSPTNRARLLDQLRASDRSLAEELSSLLAADARADTALETGGLVQTANLRGPPIAGALEIPGYRVVAVLGEGGMGRVYAAEQHNPRRPVAIKVLHARSGSAIARFQTEAAIMAHLDHPGIARVLEAGDADGHPFLVMEHVEGETLDRHARPLTREQRLGLVVAICDAVHHAHDNGVIHRDLKPSNVMVRPDGRVVVLDFGVARLADDDASALHDTVAGELIGTPIYMSPEQAKLRPDEVDARSDVYTLGVILYELLCDQLPYDVRGLSLAGVTAVICEREPTPLGKHDPALRGDLEAITTTALHKDPRERYQSAAELAADVRRHLARLPVSVHTPGAIERVARLVRRRPLAATAAAAAVVAAATCAIVFTWLWSDARTARRTSQDARGRSELARGELQSRINQLALRQARAALVTNPTDALARLATMSRHEDDASAAWAIADEALGRGVAHDVLRGHSDEVRWIEPLPDSDSFVTGAYDGRVVLWEPPDYQPHIVFQARSGRIHVARPSPDGTMIAAGGDGGALHVLARDGRLVAELTGHAGKVERMAWSRNGQLATADDQGNVWLWAGARGPGKRLQAANAVIGSVGFSANGDALVAVSHSGAVWLWDLTADTMSGANIDAKVIDTWTDGQRVIAVDDTGIIHTWHKGRGALVVDRAVATGLATKRAVFSADGGSVVLGGVGGAATRVEGTAIETIARHSAQVRYIALTPDGQRIATASDDGVLQVVDRATGRRWTLRGHHARIRHLAFARGVLLSSDGEGVVRRWDLAAMPPSVLVGLGAPIERMAASPDGRQLASIDAAGEVARWTLVDAGHTALGHLDGRVTALAVADGTVVTGTAEGHVTWWLDKPLQHGVRGTVKSIAVSRDRIAIATSTGPIAMFTLDGKPLLELPGNTGGTEAVAFDPDGAHLAAGGQDRAIRVWRRDGDAFVPCAELAGPTGDTGFVVFSPHGDRLFTGGKDGNVFGWRVTERELDPATRVVLARHTGAISALAVSPDGEFLASSGRDDSVVRVVLATGASESFALGTPASVIAFDPTGAIHAVTRGGAVMEQTAHGFATTTDHGVRAAAAILPDRVAITGDDGAIVIESLRVRTFEQLAATRARATRLSRAP